MQPDYSTMKMDALVDLLAQETRKITHLLAERKFGNEYKEIKKNIAELQKAIDHQKKVSQK